MAAIQPDSTILIYHGMPLDNNYEHTLYFAAKGLQYSWFSSASNPHLKHTFTKNTYQRVNSGVFEAHIKADELYDCNYMAFKNTAYGGKWFFAFINSVEFINNENSYVYYEIDVIQTYLYDGAILEQCMIEREHTPTDFIGEHILPEPVECVDYEFGAYHSLTSELHNLDLAYIAVMVCNSTTTQSPIPTGIYDNIFAGCDVRIFNTSDQSEIGTFLNNYITSPQSIVAMYMIPRVCIKPTVVVPNAGLTLSSGDVGASITVSLPAPSLNDTFGGTWLPKNMKLYTYPYNYVQVNTPDGNCLPLRYEFFDQNTPMFALDSCIMPPVQVKLTPMYYRNSYDGVTNKMMAESLTLTGYPMCGWSYDSFTAWQAMNTVPMLVNAGMSVFSNAASGSISGIAGTVGNVFSQSYHARLAEGVPQGNFASGNVDFAKQMMQFYGGRKHITEEVAKSIDGFFTMFGYKVNRLGTPILNNRPHYTYIKTIGCGVKGLCPADAAKQIASIFDNGITFWINENEVGNYSVDNSPVTEGD